MIEASVLVVDDEVIHQGMRLMLFKMNLPEEIHFDAIPVEAYASYDLGQENTLVLVKNLEHLQRLLALVDDVYMTHEAKTISSYKAIKLLDEYPLYKDVIEALSDRGFKLEHKHIPY